jgi:hypothetical protein
MISRTVVPKEERKLEGNQVSSNSMGTSAEYIPGSLSHPPLRATLLDLGGFPFPRA